MPKVLHIDPGTIFQDLQKEFSDFYPFLRIDFLRTVSAERKVPIETNRIYYQERVGRITKELIYENIGVEENRTVQQIIDCFEKKLGVSVVILRKAGNSWIQTLLTSGWSLGRQNREGMLISDPDGVSSGGFLICPHSE